jgi:hypothetical protein
VCSPPPLPACARHFAVRSGLILNGEIRPAATLLPTRFPHSATQSTPYPSPRAAAHHFAICPEDSVVRVNTEGGGRAGDKTPTSELQPPPAHTESIFPPSTSLACAHHFAIRPEDSVWPDGDTEGGGQAGGDVAYARAVQIGALHLNRAGTGCARVLDGGQGGKRAQMRRCGGCS